MPQKLAKQKLVNLRELNDREGQAVADKLRQLLASLGPAGFSCCYRRAGWTKRDVVFYMETWPPVPASATKECQHPRLKGPFTFSTGETIVCCPDCETFDAKRQAVLKAKSTSYRWHEWDGWHPWFINNAVGDVLPLLKRCTQRAHDAIMARVTEPPEILSGKDGRGYEWFDYDSDKGDAANRHEEVPNLWERMRPAAYQRSWRNYKVRSNGVSRDNEQWQDSRKMAEIRASYRLTIQEAAYLWDVSEKTAWRRVIEFPECAEISPYCPERCVYGFDILNLRQRIIEDLDIHPRWPTKGGPIQSAHGATSLGLSEGDGGWRSGISLSKWKPRGRRFPAGCWTPPPEKTAAPAPLRGLTKAITERYAEIPEDNFLTWKLHLLARSNPHNEPVFGNSTSSPVRPSGSMVFYGPSMPPCDCEQCRAGRDFTSQTTSQTCPK